jgi:hypothetical protein
MTHHPVPWQLTIAITVTIKKIKGAKRGCSLILGKSHPFPEKI